MFFTKISINNPVFATMVMVALMVVGIYSYQRLPIESLPDVDFPVVAVVMAYPGASPEAVENEIIKPIENAVNTINGIDSIQSTAQPNQAMVIIIFDMDIDSSVAAQDVRDRLATITGSFPSEANDPQILRFDPGEMPIISLAVSSTTLSTRELTQLTENTIVKRLSIIRGVGRATVVGGIPRQFNIDIDPDKLVAYNIGVGQVSAALQQANQNVPAGTVTEQLNVQTIQVDGVIENPEEFLDIIVAYQGGYPIHLRDVATLSDGVADVGSMALLNGERALAIDIVKTQGTNTVEVAESIRKEIAALSDHALPEGVIISVVRDNAIEVESSFESVKSMLIEGALLTVLIVFLFLNSWRSTVITGLTLPISIIGTMVVLNLLGFTLNMMTLMALSLAVGLLIDDAIVVRENIMRHLHMGKAHKQAALDGTNEIGLAVLATTLSIVAVFLPVAFMDGIIGRFFLQFGITVSVSVLISLFVAFTLDPMMSSVWYDPAADPDAKRGRLGNLVNKFDQFFEGVAAIYISILRWSLRHRLATLGVATLLLVGSTVVLFPFIGAEFTPAVDNSELQIDFEAPDGSSLEYTAVKAKQIDTLLKTYPEVKGTYTTINGGMRGGNGENTGTVMVSLTPPEDRNHSAMELTSVIREALHQIPGLHINVGSSNGFGGVTAPVQINLYGDDFKTLERITRELTGKLENIEGLKDIESSYNAAKPIVGIKINKDAANDLGISLQQIGATLRPMLSGEEVTEWTSPDGDTFTVSIRLADWARSNVEALKQLPISQSGVTGSASVVRLEQVATIIETTGPSEINRLDLSRQVTLSANLSGAGLGDVMGPIGVAIESMNLPVGYRINMGGDSEQLAETAVAAGSALLLAIIFIYLVLASQFGSFLQPIAIMVSLPLAIIGVMLGLLVGGSTLNIYSIIGFIMLMGLVVKNAILLVDNANQHRKEGIHLMDALLAAGKTRFRPIVMTTLAMIFGMLPMALNLHGGSGENAPMAHAVIGGLISSTLLTLIVVPVVLTYIDSMSAFFSRLFSSQSAQQHPTHEI